MATPELDTIVWRKSSYSADQGDCIEVGWSESPGVAVRDSKQISGPTLAFPTADWRGFLATID